jgi:lipopolysaccharide export system permease protein
VQKLDWYFVRSVAIWTAVVLLVLVSFYSIGVLVDELNAVGKANYGAAQAVYIVLLRTPNFMHEVFAVSLLLGGLLAFGGLARNNEIIAMRAAGVSIFRLFKSVMKTGILMVSVGLIIGEVIAPTLQHKSDQLRAHWLNYPTLLQSIHGVWLRDQNNFINIQSIRPNGELNNLSIYQFDDQHRLQTLLMAAKAELRDGQWLLLDVQETRLHDTRVETELLISKTMDIGLDPDFVKNVSIEPEMLSILALRDYNNFLKKNQLSIPEYEIAFWTRLAVPVIGLLMLLIALPFALASTRNIDIAKRLTMGAILGVVIILVLKSASFAGVVYNLPPIIVAWGPVLVLALGVAYTVRRLA